jgi:hypothetical protein
MNDGEERGVHDGERQVVNAGQGRDVHDREERTLTTARSKA